jgi:hypothetical protein
LWKSLSPHPHKSKGAEEKMLAAGQISGQILAGFSLKGPKRGRILKIFSFLYFFHLKAWKTRIFSQISVLVWLQKFKSNFD